MPLFGCWYPSLSYLSNEFALEDILGYLFCMTLDGYLRKNKITSLQFARLMRASVHAVRKWRQGIRIPRPPNIRKIEKLTNNKVKPKDWY